MNLLSPITERPESVVLARDPEVLAMMLRFYARPGAAVLDVTANKRTMWKGVDWINVTFSDMDPEMHPDIVQDFRAMTVSDASYDILVFDPPHLPAAAASPESLDDYQGRYGLGSTLKGDNISGYFAPFLSEAVRVLRPDGLIFAKLKDFVHNHAYQWMLADFIAAVRAQHGLTPCDLIVKRDPCGGNLKSSKWKTAHHARNTHCWWIVVRKGRCEAKLSKTDNL